MVRNIAYNSGQRFEKRGANRVPYLHARTPDRAITISVRENHNAHSALKPDHGTDPDISNPRGSRSQWNQIRSKLSRRVRSGLSMVRNIAYNSGQRFEKRGANRVPYLHART